MQKGKKVFNILIVIIIIAFISVIGYIAYYYISNYIALKNAEKIVDEFENEVIVVALEDEVEDNQEEPNKPQETANKTNSKGTYNKGYSVIGTIRIPKTNIKSPIVDKVTTKSISAAVAVLYGPGLNKVGNTVLVAHNYNNGSFFGSNKKLVVGDKIYITDSTGTKIEYTIYKTYTTTDTDFDYATRDTKGKREISLSTCTKDASKRLVIWAKES